MKIILSSENIFLSNENTFYRMEIYILSTKKIFIECKYIFYRMKIFLSNANIFFIEWKYFIECKYIFIEFCYISATILQVAMSNVMYTASIAPIHSKLETFTAQPYIWEDLMLRDLIARASENVWPNFWARRVLAHQQWWQV